MHTLRYTLIAVYAAGAIAATAQSLQKEITVQHDVIPEHADVAKIRFSPQFALPQLQHPQLDYSTQGIFTPANPSITTLGPAAYADTISTTSCRGYANLGLAPIFNLCASAGYKFLDNDRTRLNAWLQYDGTAYKGRYDSSPLDKQYQRSNTVTASATLHHALERDRYLDVGIDYTFARFSTPVSPDSTGRQQVHRFNLNTLYCGTTASLAYDMGIDAGYFSNAFAPHHDPYTSETAQSLLPQLRPAREFHIGAQGGVSSAISEHQRAGIALKFSLLSNSRHSHAAFIPDMNDYSLMPQSRHTHGLLTFSPHYRMRTEAVELHAGIKAQFTFNSGKFFHIAPDVNLSWRPVPQVALYAKAGGGEWQNSLTSLFDAAPHASGCLAYKNSHIPVTVEGGLTLGPLSGAAVELSWQYAASNEWLMPATADNGLTLFTPVNMRGYKFHAGLNYNYGSLIEFRAAYETAPQKAARGFYLWRDRSRHIVTADLRVSPASFIDIFAGWEYRGSRAQISPESGHITPLGHISNLKLGVLYRITPRWSAFARGENLLCRRYLLIGGVPAQGISGLVGASYKF